uniref:Uncharacterized protein n=1 Tax=Ditylenchus dipsaci TaxID=166011 RepID=A0A915E4Z4_9BILA
MEIRKLVSAFLEKFFSSFLADVVTLDKAISTEKHLMECELHCLLEIYLLRAFPRPLSQTNIVQKLRSLFFASNSERIKKFLNETAVTSSWKICPCRLLEYMKNFFWMPLSIYIDFSLRSRSSEVNRKFMSEFEKTSEEDKNIGEKAALSPKKRNKRSRNVDASKEKLAKRKKRKVSSISPVPSDYKKPHARRRLVHVPETPEEKLLLNISRPGQYSEGRYDEAADRDVVPNTPIGKIRNNISDQSKIAQLVKKEENV